jgi:hypothetical protein
MIEEVATYAVRLWVPPVAPVCVGTRRGTFQPASQGTVNAWDSYFFGKVAVGLYVREPFHGIDAVRGTYYHLEA